MFKSGVRDGVAALLKAFDDRSVEGHILRRIELSREEKRRIRESVGESVFGE